MCARAHTHTARSGHHSFVSLIRLCHVHLFVLIYVYVTQNLPINLTVANKNCEHKC